MLADLALYSDRCSRGFHLQAQHPQLCDCQGDGEWGIFTAALRSAAKGGVIDQDDVRPLIRGRIEPKHIGTLYRQAKAEGLIRESTPKRSADHEGRNAGRWEPTYEWLGGAA